MQYTSRWLSANVLLCSLAHGVWHMFNQSLTPLLPLIMEDFALSYVQIGLLLTASSTFKSVLIIPIGHLSDRMGRRKHFISLGLCLSAASFFLMGLANTFNQLLLFQLLAGVGGTAYHAVGPVLVAQSSSKTRGKAMGIEGFAGASGSAAGPLLAGIIGVFSGWRSSLHILAILGFMTSPVVWKFGREPKEEFKTGNPPEDSKDNGPHFHLIVPLAVTILIFGLRNNFWWGVSKFIPLYLVKSRSMSVGVATMLFASSMMVGSMGQLIGGALSDAKGWNKTVVSSTAIAALSMLFFTAVPKILLGPVMYFSCFAYFAGTPPLRALIADLATPSTLAMVFGLTYTVTAIVATVTPTVFGYLADLVGLEIIFLLVSVSLVVVVGLVLVLDRKVLK